MIFFALTLTLAAQTIDPRFANPNDWLTYDRDNTGQRYSPLTQVTRANVSQLKAEWVFQITRLPTRSEATPLVRDGIMYFTVGGEEAYALDARTGRVLWNYLHKPAMSTESADPSQPPRQGANWNRGMAISGTRVFMATSDCRLLSIDSRNGSLAWQANVREGLPCFGTTGAPLILGSRVLMGERGGDTGQLRGHLDAYDMETGKLSWRWFTIPAPGEPHADSWPATDVWKVGGAATWTSGTYDPDLNLVFWPTGNPGPKDFDGSDRKGDNLYSNSVVALRPSSGERVWHYQFTPHDVWDWDSNETPVLIDAPWQGTPRKLLVQANRNGYLYVVDRTTGRFLRATSFAKATWAREFTSDGRAIPHPTAMPNAKGARVCPDVHGGTNWQPPAYNPQTGLFYLTARDSCGIYFPNGPTIDFETQQPRQFFRAIEVGTGKVRWEFAFEGVQEVNHAGAMTTAGGLVFFSSREGQFLAADAATGKVLWHFNTGGAIRAGPMTYSVRGKQYVAIMSKAAVFAFALP
ncbi:MAG: PQQ-binding-like beta-propeller repeat protein [Bryobacteraceae bacterium]